MYKVTYTIDVDAANPVEAAKKAYQYMQKSQGPILVVQSPAGQKFNVDLDGLTGIEVNLLPPDKPVCTCGLTPAQRNWIDDKTAWGL